MTWLKTNIRILADKSTKIFAVGGVGLVSYGAVANSATASSSGWGLVGASLLTFFVGALLRRVN